MLTLTTPCRKQTQMPLNDPTTDRREAISANTALEVATRMDLHHHIESQLYYDRHPQERTKVFHEVFDAPIRPYFKKPDPDFAHMSDERVAFRTAFILSEAFEILEQGFGLNVRFDVSGDGSSFHHTSGSNNAGLAQAILGAMKEGTGKRDLIGVVDGLGDLNVVVNGFAVELGIDMRPVDREIFASNLTKLGADGQPIVADGSDPSQPAGKILKGPNYVEPNIAAAIGLCGSGTPE